jgi:uncharacterized membrane protein
MYSFVLTLHSLVRWAVVIVGIIAVIMAFAGWFGNRRWTSSTVRLNMLFTTFLDLNILLGFFLYFILSPLTRGALQNMGDAMKDSNVRFFTVEHWLIMLVAVVVAHIGSSRAKKAADDKSKFKQAAIFFTIAMILIFLGIPWPFLATGAGRGLF